MKKKNVSLKPPGYLQLLQLVVLITHSLSFRKTFGYEADYGASQKDHWPLPQTAACLLLLHPHQLRNLQVQSSGPYFWECRFWYGIWSLMQREAPNPHVPREPQATAAGSALSLPRVLLAYVAVVSHTLRSHLRQFLQNQRLCRSVVHA